MSQISNTLARPARSPQQSHGPSGGDPYSTATLPGRSNPLLRGESAVRQDPSRLKASDIRDIDQLVRGAEWSKVHDAVALLESGAAIARSSLVAATTMSHGSFLSRCASWVGRGFGLFASPLHRAQAEVSLALKRLQEYSAQSVKPVTEEISRRYEGKTFVRTKDTSRALVLASIPTALKHLDHNFDYLKQGIRNLVKESGGALREINGLGVQRIVVSRKAEDGKVETLEFAFRREGKVNVFLNGQEQGSMWNGKAIDVAKKFAMGKTPSFVTKTYREYTVKPPCSEVETGQAPVGQSQTRS